MIKRFSINSYLKLWNYSKTIIAIAKVLFECIPSYSQTVSIHWKFIYFCQHREREYYLITPESSQRYRWSGKKCLFNNDKLDFQLTYCLICIISCIVSYFVQMWIETANWVSSVFFDLRKSLLWVTHDLCCKIDWLQVSRRQVIKYTSNIRS